MPALARADTGLQAGAGVRKPPREETAGRKGAGGELPAYGDLAIGRAAARGLGGAFSRWARTTVAFGTGGSRSNGGSAGLRTARSAARIGFCANREAPAKPV